MDTIARLFPIRFVSHQTGLSAHVIRAWEKRYAAVRPQRTDTNRRLYNQRDVERLTLLRRLSENGQAISSIAHLTEEELRDRLLDIKNPESGNETRPALRPQSTTPSQLLNRCYDAVLKYDRESLEETLMEAHVEFSQPRFMDDFLGPLLKWIGEGWHSGELRVAQEHTATAGIRNVLGNLQLLAKVKPNAPSMVVASPSDEQHELGALMACLVAAAQGWRTVFLGARVPPQEIAAAAKMTSSKLVAISASVSGSSGILRQEINLLANLLPRQTKLIVGGAGALACREQFESANLNVVDNFQEFATLLSENSN
jgi:DNA-binding transcriptional MerR regulator/methylmalonyl-CoA mutase cobalamin-binding subunit